MAELSPKLIKEQERRLSEYEASPANFIATHYATLTSGNYDGKRCKHGDCKNCPDFRAHNKMLDDIESRRFYMELEIVTECDDFEPIPIYVN